jgi:microcystin-dependent protein
MSGCSYGSLTVTKLTCDEIQMTSIPTATTCPESVSCTGACKAYENQQPYPDMRNTCERACSTIVPSACSRVLQIYKDLYKSSSP